VNKLVAAGEIGEVRLVRENERRNSVFGAPNLMWRPGHWTGDPKISLGVALLAGIHEVDILRWFVGSEPHSVFAQHSVTTEGNIGVPDFLSLTVKFANGGIGSSEISRMPPASYPAFHQLELYGSEGAMRAKDHECIGLTRYSAGGADFQGYQEMLLQGGPTYTRQLAEFVASIKERRAPSVLPHDARTALAMALAAVQSAKSGQPVNLERAP
jgi:predicted dehydrogenase